MRCIWPFCILLAFIIIPALSVAQDKKVINSLDDIPRFSYKIDGKASEVYQDPEKFGKLYKKIKEDYNKVLKEYTFNDRSLRKDILNTLKQIDFYENNLQEARINADAIRELEDKPAARYMSGIVNTAFLNAAANYKPETNDFRTQFKNELTQLVNAMPWDVVQDAVEQTKGSMEIISENLFLGIIQENMDHVVEQTGELSGDFATALVSYRYNSQFVIPYKQEIIEVLSDYINSNFVEKENIWVNRDLDISSLNDLHDVMVAIWDSGIDTQIFQDQIYTNTKEFPDGKDNDGNGYIDDIHGIAYDLENNKETDLLYPLSQDQLNRLPQMTDMMKGITDLTSNINSKEASELKKTLSGIQPEEVKPLLEELSLFGNYAHGTHVAGIAAKGNPKAILMASRITFDYKFIPDVPTIEKARKEVEAVEETIEYYKANHVRIVNMSFGGNPQGIETALELNGIGKSPEDRKKLAREIFDISKEGFYNAMKDAPEILFVAAAGNSDDDAEFYEFIPSSFDLPNILTVGAVDQAGEETDFTSFGENVDVHANGFEVESYIPGGKLMKLSGTSMAAPNVVNLAAKLMAIDPDLTVAETIVLIKEGCDRSADGRINLINPQKSIALITTRNK
jgi:subtilisin family serine protease